MILHAVDQLNHQRELLVRVRCDHLKWSKQLASRRRECLVGCHDGFYGDEDGGGLHRTIAVWDRVPLEGLAPKRQVGSGQLQARVDVILNLRGCPGDDRADGQLRELALARARAQLANDVLLHPLLVRYQHRLRRALLARGRVGVLVRLPHYVVDGSWVRPEDLPIEAGVLELHLAVEVDGELLGDALRAREEAHPRVTPHHDFVHHRPIAVDVVNVCGRQSAMMEHPDELLHADRHPPVDFDERLIAHEEG
mmetsp:Transcript_11058/g.28313  ORF Transcript_11058/g.28313 Transcript_11058/m.28313 type:complete len:252 (+) Transcript_11058:574-1329(+)